MAYSLSPPSSRPVSPMGPPPQNHFGKRPTLYNPITFFREYRHPRLLRILALASLVVFFCGMWSFYSRDSTTIEGIQSQGGGAKASGGNVTMAPSSPLSLLPPTQPAPAKFEHGKNPPNDTLAFDMEYHLPPPPEFGIPSGAEDVVLVIKTGGNVMWNRFPVHAATTLKRVPYFLVFSDLADKVGDVIIHDCLKDVNDKIKLQHSQFEIYRTMNGLQPPPFEVSLANTMSNETSQQDREKVAQLLNQGDGISAPRPANLDIAKLDLDGGWDLDKYKNVPILYQTFRVYPNKKWYVFIDADTTVFWTGLVKYLTTELDHTKPYYGGAPTLLGKEVFAHGGTGYIVSHEAARMAVEDHPELEHAYEEYAITDCCGDHIFSRVMEKIGIGLQNERPRVQGDPWYGLRWDSYNWCERVWTFHHITPKDIQLLYDFERYMYTTVLPHSGDTRKSPSFAKDQILYGDLYHYFVKPHLTALESGWDNLSNDEWFHRPDSKIPSSDEVSKMTDEELKEKWEKYLGLNKDQKASIESHENCARVCKEKDDCLQWKWKGGSCVLNHSLRFGRKDLHPKGKVDGWWSGWMLKRIEELRKQMECEAGREGGFPAQAERDARGGAEREKVATI